jgi:hypothetical protein
MTRSLETRLAQLEERQPVKDRLVFRVVDDLTEVARLEALHPDALVIHRTVVSLPDSGLHGRAPTTRRLSPADPTMLP